MKLLLCVAALTATAVLTHAQGTVNFANSTSTKVYYPNINAEFSPIPTGAAGSNFVAGLFWGTEGSSQGSLSMIATTQLWQPFTGVFSGGTVTFPVSGGIRVTLQVRVWYLANPEWIAYGPLQLITLGGAGSPPGAPASLTAPTAPGDTPISSFTFAVPEPSRIALGLLGLGAIAMMRRKK